jgi:hypothetical protein
MYEDKTDQSESLTRNIGRLRHKQAKRADELTSTAIRERKEAQVNASGKYNVIRDRVRELEKKNLAKFSQLKDIDTQLQQREDDLLRKTGKMDEALHASKAKQSGLREEGEKRVASLEAQLNAVISAVTAPETYTDSEELNILERVEGAVGVHAASVRRVEDLNAEIRAMGRQLDDLSLREKSI